MEKQVYTWINGGEGWWAFAYKDNAKGQCGGSPRVGRLSFCNHHNKASVGQESSIDTKCRGMGRIFPWLLSVSPETAH